MLAPAMPWIQSLALDPRQGWHAWVVSVLSATGSDPPTQWWQEASQWAKQRGLCTASGAPLAFEPAPSRARISAADYETMIHDTGRIAVRTSGIDGWHDLSNAAQWLVFPHSKRVLNALQWHAIGSQCGQRTRSALRDAITLIDEGAVLWLGAPSLWDALAQRRWREVFVERRAELEASGRLLPFGHGLMQRLRQPYKALTGWAIALPRADGAPSEAADASLAAWLSAQCLTDKPWCALPVLAWPGWSEDNTQSSFYDDPQVFRPAVPESTKP